MPQQIVAHIQMKGDQIMIMQDQERGVTVGFKYRGRFCDWAVWDSTDQDEIIDWIITPIPDQRWVFRVDGDEEEDLPNIQPK